MAGDSTLYETQSAERRIRKSGLRSLGVLMLVLLSFAAASVTALDFTPHGTQPGLLSNLNDASACSSCHRGYDATTSRFLPHNTWGGSMMANAARDPLFWAALDVANNDIPGVGDYCIRCHTPRGWLRGHSTKPENGGAPNPQGALGCLLEGGYDRPDGKLNDYGGVDCHFCHRMMPSGPQGQASFVENANFWVDDALECLTPDGSGYGGPCRRGPYNYTDGHLTPPHGWVYSAYHESSAICGNCHNVTSPQTDAGTYAQTLRLANGTDTGIPFPIERTYSEWKQSLFADTIFRDGLTEAPAGTPAIARAEQCQQCHMRDSQDPAAKACQQNPAGSRTGNLPLHELVGGNTWIPAIIKGQYGGNDGLGHDADYDQTIAAARLMLESSAQVSANVTSYTAATPGGTGSISANVDIVNLSGHKLPTGYSEGRRMWINVQVRDGNANVVAESAAYNPSTGALTLDAQAKVYETLQGIWDAGTSTCKTEEGGRKLFHFVLNNCIAKDNRIPPLGFRPKTAQDPNGYETQPVGYTYPETTPGSGVLVNRDRTPYTFVIPAGTQGPVSLRVALKYQISSKEYIEFLRDEAIEHGFPAENTLCAGGPDRPFDSGPQSQSRGEYMYSLWNNPAYGKSPPEDVQVVSVPAARPAR